MFWFVVRNYNWLVKSKTPISVWIQKKFGVSNVEAERAARSAINYINL